MGKSLKVSQRRRRRQAEAPEAPEFNGSWPDIDYYFNTHAGDLDLSALDFGTAFGGGDPTMAMLGERERHLMDLMSLPDTCLFRNILHVWNYDVDRIRALDQAQIIADVNSALIEGFVFSIMAISFSTLLLSWAILHPLRFSSNGFCSMQEKLHGDGIPHVPPVGHRARRQR